jgi:hypothetical protein
MESGIYDAKGKLLKSVNTEQITNTPASAGVAVSSGTIIGAQTSTNSNYVGNIVIRDALGNVAIFIGLE